MSSAGDVDGNGVDDLVIGAPFATTNAGNSYILYSDVSPTVLPSSMPSSRPSAAPKINKRHKQTLMEKLYIAGAVVGSSAGFVIAVPAFFGKQICMHVLDMYTIDTHTGIYIHYEGVKRGWTATQLFTHCSNFYIEAYIAMKEKEQKIHELEDHAMHEHDAAMNGKNVEMIDQSGKGLLADKEITENDDEVVEGTRAGVSNEIQSLLIKSRYATQQAERERMMKSQRSIRSASSASESQLINYRHSTRSRSLSSSSSSSTGSRSRSNSGSSSSSSGSEASSADEKQAHLQEGVDLFRLAGKALSRASFTGPPGPASSSSSATQQLYSGSAKNTLNKDESKDTAEDEEAAFGAYEGAPLTLGMHVVTSSTCFCLFVSCVHVCIHSRFTRPRALLRCTLVQWSTSGFIAHRRLGRPGTRLHSNHLASRQQDSANYSSKLLHRHQGT